ncbi:MAG: hypothetical protein ACREQV_16480, partial [Candidatus Binatia bacterium]
HSRESGNPGFWFYFPASDFDLEIWDSSLTRYRNQEDNAERSGFPLCAGLTEKKSRWLLEVCRERYLACPLPLA